MHHAWTNVFAYKPISLSTMDYEEYWAGDHSKGFEHDSRIGTLMRIIEPSSMVVEIGCGDGTLLAILRNRKGAQVVGYDVSATAISKARAKGITADVRDATVCGLNGEHPDYVIIADCLEHLPVPENLFNRLRGNVRKAIIVSIPNSCYWRYRLRVLFGSFMVQWVAHPGEHLRFWSIRDMYWWVEQLGFRVQRRYSTWGVPLLKHLWPSMFAQNSVWVITEDCSIQRPSIAR